MPDFEGEGYLAAETLDSMMHGKGPDSCVLLADIKEVVRRESTCELSSAGRLVQKAVVYIDRHALEGIGVEDVVRHLGCSRRLADLRFRELQKRSILQAITERRLDEVKRRLRETREKIDSIAAACGYTNPNYLKNLFKKRFAMSMRDFRRVTWKG
jgi:AraC-like DNA-binding protein